APGQPNDPGSAAFPRMIALALAALAILQLLRPQRGWSLPQGAAAARVAGVVALLAAYAALLEPLGFILASFGFLLAAFLMAGVRKPLFLTFLPAAISVTLYYVFYELLEVPLPQGLIEGLLP
ncbi:MAG: tripartite tricarboxylate transporter TctB family protein, partial [Actinomycetota bacterium]